MTALALAAPNDILTETASDKHERFSRLENPESQGILSKACDYFKDGLSFLNRHKGKIAIAGLAIAAALAGAWLLDQIPHSFSLIPGFADSGHEILSTSSDAALSTGSEVASQLAAEHADKGGSIVEVLLNGDPVYNKTPIEIDGIKYSFEQFKDALGTLAPNPELGDGFSFTVGEEFRPSGEIKINEILKEAGIPFSGHSSYRSQLHDLFDPHGNFQKTLYGSN